MIGYIVYKWLYLGNDVKVRKLMWFYGIFNV